MATDREEWTEDLPALPVPTRLPEYTREQMIVYAKRAQAMEREITIEEIKHGISIGELPPECSKVVTWLVDGWSGRE